jgi:hypothetical protein
MAELGPLDLILHEADRCEFLACPGSENTNAVVKSQISICCRIPATLGREVKGLTLLSSSFTLCGQLLAKVYWRSCHGSNWRRRTIMKIAMACALLSPPVFYILETMWTVAFRVLGLILAATMFSCISRTQHQAATSARRSSRDAAQRVQARLQSMKHRDGAIGLLSSGGLIDSTVPAFASRTDSSKRDRRRARQCHSREGHLESQSNISRFPSRPRRRLS